MPSSFSLLPDAILAADSSAFFNARSSVKVTNALSSGWRLIRLKVSAVISTGHNNFSSNFRDI
jgi:hypothetical protein